MLGVIQNTPEFTNMGAAIVDLPAQPNDTEVNLEWIYRAIRDADSDKSDNAKMQSLKSETAWPLIVTKTLVAKATSNIDGKYQIKAIKGGHYLIYARESTRFSAIEWLIPLDIEASGDVSKDLYNGNAKEILNKDD